MFVILLAFKLWKYKKYIHRIDNTLKIVETPIVSVLRGFSTSTRTPSAVLCLK